jgi:8-oxo-dGTP pyrophosphatase MutT (NUDIX family)
VVIERDGRVLLVKHSYGPRAWSFPGGGKKREEPLELTAVREAKEETGLLLGEVTFIGNFVTDGEYKKDHVHVYLAKSPDGEVRIDGEEIVAYEWAMHNSERKWTPIGEKIWGLYLAHKSLTK